MSRSTHKRITYAQMYTGLILASVILGCQSNTCPPNPAEIRPEARGRAHNICQTENKVSTSLYDIGGAL